MKLVLYLKQTENNTCSLSNADGVGAVHGAEKLLVTWFTNNSQFLQYSDSNSV